MLNHQIILQQMIEDDQSNILHVIEWQPKKDEILVFLLLPEEYNRLLYMVILKETGQTDRSNCQLKKLLLVL